MVFLAGCRSDAQPQTVHADGATLLAYLEEGSAWEVLSLDEVGDASFEPEAPFTLVRVCPNTQVRVVLAAPSDGADWALGCGEGFAQVEISAPGLSGFVFIGLDSNSFIDSVTMTAQPGVHDVVFISDDLRRMVVLRDVVIGGATTEIEIGEPLVELDERAITLARDPTGDEVLANTGLVTRSGTVASWFADADGVAPDRAWVPPSSVLLSGDRTWVTARSRTLTGPVDEPHGFHTIDVRDSSGPIEIDLDDREGGARIDSFDPVEITWDSGPVERDRITAEDFDDWRIDAYPGWLRSNATTRTVRLPTIAPPGWDPLWDPVSTSSWAFAIGTVDGRRESRGVVLGYITDEIPAGITP
jgi:hypothetical protein